MIATAARRWNLEIEARLGGLASRVVACHDAAGHKLVLKVAPPEAYPDQEAAALRHWSGNGAVPLVDFASDLGALLMERIAPGSPLPPAHDEELTALVAATLVRLHAVSPPAHGAFPTQEEFFAIWLDRVHASAEPGTVGVALLDRARDAALALEATAARKVLLHGDFIDKNLLRAEESYVGIDPLPRIGDACSDVGFYAAYHQPAGRIASRAKLFARVVHLDELRCARWAAVWAVGEATETWRADSAELQNWVGSKEARELLETR